MTQQRSRAEATDGTAIVSQAYDLALLHIVDERMAFAGATTVDVRARMVEAMFDAIGRGISDVDALAAAGIAAVTMLNPEAEVPSGDRSRELRV